MTYVRHVLVIQLCFWKSFDRKSTFRWHIQCFIDQNRSFRTYSVGITPGTAGIYSYNWCLKLSKFQFKVNFLLFAIYTESYRHDSTRSFPECYKIKKNTNFIAFFQTKSIFARIMKFCAFYWYYHVFLELFYAFRNLKTSSQ